MWDFLVDRSAQVWTLAWTHAFLVAVAVLLATIIGIAVAVGVTRAPKLEPVANAISSIGLTIPSFALVGLLLPLLGLGFWPSLVAVGFYAIFPVLRNAVVGLQGVNPDLLESAKGMGMSEAKSLFRVRLPLAWPVILAGVRVSHPDVDGGRRDRGVRPRTGLRQLDLHRSRPDRWQERPATTHSSPRSPS